MTDTSNGKRLQVLDGGAGGLFIELPLSQLAEVRRRLDREGVFYWVDSYAISIEDEPPITVINLGLNNDAGRVQSILDETR
jgi:hypothetical protein